MGWMSVPSKQKIEVFRYYLRLQTVDRQRLLYKVHQWSSRRRSSWDSCVLKTAEKYKIENLITHPIGRCSKMAMRKISSRLRQLDESSWFHDLWNDGKNVNGNKLRTYRKFKKDLRVETYVSSFIPRPFRAVLAKLRCGSLPLNVETGRYCTPPVPFHERFCPFCPDTIETEEHFLCTCVVYDDIRSALFDKAKEHSVEFTLFNAERKLVSLMQNESIQYLLGKVAYLMLKRRRALL